MNVNDQLVEELHKPVIKSLIEQKPMRALKKIFGQQI